ncbi:hypothetical protein Tco_1490291 [Tanacetum coccineum]
MVQSSNEAATEIPTEKVATMEVNIQFSMGSPESGRLTSVSSVVGSPGGIYQPGWGMTNDCHLDNPDACQDIVDHIVPLGAVESKVHGLQNQTKNLKTLLEAEVMSEEKIKVAFEEFKKYEDDKVEQRCAEMDARLDKLSVDFNEELYPHMLTVIAGHRWVIGHGLRLVVMKCAESSEIRQAFVDVVSTRLAKGMSEGLKYGIEHGKVGRDLADIERLKDAPMELILASLHLESDTKEDAP